MFAKKISIPVHPAASRMPAIGTLDAHAEARMQPTMHRESKQ
jgi:hypothetical protein